MVRSAQIGYSATELDPAKPCKIMSIKFLSVTLKLEPQRDIHPFIYFAGPFLECDHKHAQWKHAQRLPGSSADLGKWYPERGTPEGVAAC